jgi:hypothetical protein
MGVLKKRQLIINCRLLLLQITNYAEKYTSSINKYATAFLWILCISTGYHSYF